MTEPFDLDAARAARLEVKGASHWFIYGGQKFELPPELPAEFGYLLTEDSKAAFTYLLADDFDDFWAKRPSNEDLKELLDWVLADYGISEGESSASGGSSAKPSDRSRLTSSATTRSTSAKRASGRTR